MSIKMTIVVSEDERDNIMEALKAGKLREFGVVDVTLA